MRIEPVFAHCDIPCKIYDPVSAQIAGLTVVRLLSLMANISVDKKTSLENQHEMSRLAAGKEEHASIVKSEIATIWGDYFKKITLSSTPKFTIFRTQLWLRPRPVSKACPLSMVLSWSSY